MVDRLVHHAEILSAQRRLPTAYATRISAPARRQTRPKPRDRSPTASFPRAAERLYAPPPERQRATILRPRLARRQTPLQLALRARPRSAHRGHGPTSTPATSLNRQPKPTLSKTSTTQVRCAINAVLLETTNNTSSRRAIEAHRCHRPLPTRSASPSACGARRSRGLPPAPFERRDKAVGGAEIANQCCLVVAGQPKPSSHPDRCWIGVPGRHLCSSHRDRRSIGVAGRHISTARPAHTLNQHLRGARGGNDRILSRPQPPVPSHRAPY
jgi:hypothetical protein